MKNEDMQFEKKKKKSKYMDLRKKTLNGKNREENLLYQKLV